MADPVPVDWNLLTLLAALRPADEVAVVDTTQAAGDQLARVPVGLFQGGIHQVELAAGVLSSAHSFDGNWDDITDEINLSGGKWLVLATAAFFFQNGAEGHARLITTDGGAVTWRNLQTAQVTAGGGNEYMRFLLFASFEIAAGENPMLSFQGRERGGVVRKPFTGWTDSDYAGDSEPLNDWMVAIRYN